MTTHFEKMQIFKKQEMLYDTYALLTLTFDLVTPKSTCHDQPTCEIWRLCDKWYLRYSVETILSTDRQTDRPTDISKTINYTPSSSKVGIKMNGHIVIEKNIM